LSSQGRAGPGLVICSSPNIAPTNSRGWPESLAILAMMARGWKRTSRRFSQYAAILGLRPFDLARTSCTDSPNQCAACSDVSILSMNGIWSIGAV